MTHSLSLQPETDPIKKVLLGLLLASQQIRAAAVIRLSGLTIAAMMPSYVEQDRVSAMSAVIMLLGERLTTAMRNGELSKVYIQGENGHIVLRSIGGDAVLTVTASEEVPLGLVFLEMELAVEKLKALV
jgi:predicted regulator of Ras-like GTPase activity (Roadblock/LC7/MglB family)